MRRGPGPRDTRHVSTAGDLDDLGALVTCESPSGDLEAVARCAGVLADLAHRRLGAAAERVVVAGRVHLRWTFGRPRVVLVGHLDTVWPVGTLARWPYAVGGDRVTGPGVFDMKAGLVQMLAAVEALDDPEGVALLVTGDEEVGSPTSASLIEDTVRARGPPWSSSRARPVR